MALIDTINNDLKQAMLDKNQAAMRALRAIKSAILLAQTEKGASKDLSADKELSLLQKLVKQRKDSIEIFVQQNREDLASKEREEAEVIEKYLPAQMSEEELEAEVQQLIEETGASDMKDMGRVMGMASKKFAGKADNKLISQIVRAKLS